MTPIREHYERRIEELKRELSAIDKQSDAISRQRGVTFVAALALGIFGLVRGFHGWLWALPVLPLLVFGGLVVRHALVASKRLLVEERASVSERGLARMRGETEPARRDDTFGERFLKPEHAHAGDLDLFGKTSIFRLMSRAETSVGEETLAKWLLAPASVAEIRARQAAARELMGRLPLLEDLAVHAKRAESRGRAEDPLVAWAEAPAELPVGSPPGSGAPRVVSETAKKRAPLVAAARVLVPLTAVLFLGVEIAEAVPAVGAHLPKLARYAYALPLLLQVAVLGALFGPLSRMITFVTSRETPFGRFVNLFRLIETTEFESPMLREISTELRGKDGGPSASVEIARLERAISFADLRHNALIHVVADISLLYDLWCGLALERWRARSGRKARGWLRAVGTIEALASLAVFAAEHPDFAFPEVEEGPPLFDVTELGHPLIAADKRVSNTHAIDRPGRALLITGSNMSGKSTWLRSMGLCAVMAMSGSVVAAKRARLSRLEVWTSMRIRDSLEQGLSHFYAELLRLKAIQDAVRASRLEGGAPSAGGPPPVLFLLDEILHGTNSRERTLGAKSVVLDMIGCGAIGAVSSHDLHLATLEEDSGGRVENYHFSDHIEGGRMTFDYQLRRGVVRSTNALRLMKLVGLAVGDLGSTTDVEEASASDEERAPGAPT